MSIREFSSLTPDQFTAIYQVWVERQDVLQQDRWERTRIMLTYLLQPYAKGTLTPEKVMKFAWDKNKPAEVEPSTEGKFKAAIQRFEC